MNDDGGYIRLIRETNAYINIVFLFMVDLYYNNTVPASYTARFFFFYTSILIQYSFYVCVRVFFSFASCKSDIFFLISTKYDK